MVTVPDRRKCLVLEFRDEDDFLLIREPKDEPNDDPRGKLKDDLFFIFGDPPRIDNEDDFLGFCWSRIFELEVSLLGELIIDFFDFFRGELVTRRSSPGSACFGACRAAGVLLDSGLCGSAG